MGFIALLVFLQWFFLSFLNPLWAEDFERSPLMLGVGEQRILRFPNFVRYSRSGDSIRVLSREAAGKKNTRFLNSNEILIKATQPGVSELWIWVRGSDGNQDRIHQPLEVRKRTRLNEFEPILNELESFEKMDVIQVGNKVLARGELQNINEVDKISILKKNFSKVLELQLSLTPKLKQTALETIQRTKTELSMAHAFAKNWEIQDENGIPVITGYLPPGISRENIESRITKNFPLVLFNWSALPDDQPTVFFRVYLLELRQDEWRRFGLRWPDSTPSAFSVRSGSILENISLDVAIDHAQRTGGAKILAHPQLTVRSGGEAELFAGGQFPIRLTSERTADLRWKSFGILLKLEVQKTTSASIRFNLQTEMSHLDSQLESDHVPGLQINRLKTQVDAEFGRPLFLCGLLQDEVREQSKGLPWLMQIPILGNLFSSQDYLNQKSELVAILIPHKHSPENLQNSYFSDIFPQGPAPAPRNWIDPIESEEQEKNPEFPWNVLE